MSTNQEFKPYPPVCIKQNRMGHLEISAVNPIDTPLGIVYKRVNDILQSDLYFQFESDIDIILDNLPKDEKDEIEKGYTLITYFFPDDYFMVD